MKTASVALNNALKQSLAIKALPRLIAEWNQNRYAGIQEVDNANPEATHGYDQLNFPIKSIVEPNRPTKGIVKGRVCDDSVPFVPRPPFTDAVVAEGYVTDGYSDEPSNARYYLTDETDLYKYWCSPVATTTSLGGGRYGFSETVAPHVLYTTTPWTNKIVVTFETTSAVPNDYDIQITLDGSSWITVGSDIVPDNQGQVILYRQSGGSWSSTVYRDNPLQIKGIKLIVTAMNTNNVFLSLIEISARLENDLTAFVMDYGCEFTMSEASFVAPLGRASSNTGEINLSNIDSRFNNDNEESIYYGIIDKNVKMTMDLIYDVSSFGGSSSEAVRQFTMFVDDWSGQGESAVHVTLKDASKFMQEIKPTPSLYEELTLGEIVWRLCDQIGFVNYNYERVDADPATLIPYFWVDDKDTIWSIMSAFAESTQSAIYFDEYGILQIQTRNTAYDLAKAVNWELDAVVSGSKQPDIIDLSETYNFEANSVDVKYKTTKISDNNNGFPAMEVVWQPEDTVALRASALSETLTTSDTSLRIDSKDAATWPFEGIMQIEGEFIRYKDKGYYYYNQAGAYVHEYITSNDDKNRIDKELSHQDLKWKNSYSGYMKITKRGEWNTTNEIHSVDVGGYYARWGHIGSAIKNWAGGVSHVKEDSLLRLASTTAFSANTSYVVTNGLVEDAAANYYGARLKTGNFGYHGIAGIVIYNNTNDAGYYIDLTRTYACDQIGLRKYNHELSFYVRYSNGTIKRYGGPDGKGVRMFVDKNIWYDLDVAISNGTAGSHVITISLNGKHYMTVIIPSANKISATGRSGVTIRGYGEGFFEYFYAITGGETIVLDQEGYFDKVKGGWVSGQWDREWTYNWRNNYKIVNKKRVAFNQRYDNRFFDEYGPIAHEIREYNVKFEKNPVVYSRLYMSNDYQVICPEYNGNPFGAKFFLANTARVNAVLNGEDTLTFGVDNPVDQKMMIYGRLVFQEDEKSSIIKNEDAIRRRGEVTLEIASNWIQSEAAAKSIGEWINRHWSGGNDEISAEIFGNPLIQLGDMVSVNYPARDMAKTTHKYFVVSIRNDFSEGYTTKLTLRRAKI